MSEEDSDRNRLACPKCKSTDLDFIGLRNDMRVGVVDESGEEEVVSGTFRWKCKVCKHDFEITLPS
jgi:rubredoxin